MNARNFFEQQQKPSLRRNQFGGTVSGPVEIPKLYDGRNKSFWIFNYEGMPAVSRDQLSTIPTQGQLSGDLSTVAQASIKDPFTGAVFPNKQIPASRIDSATKAFVRYMPVATWIGGAWN